MRSKYNGFAVGAGLTGALAVAALLGAPAASASTDHAVPQLTTHQERAAAAAAATNGARELLATAARGAAARAHSAGATTAGAPRIAADGVPVYALSASFVRGQSETVGQLWYVATPASTSAGPMTVFTAKSPSGDWRAVNVATGNTEARMAKAADGASLLVEPQVNAWYAVSTGSVRPLNSAARKVIGNAAVPVASYQRIVHTRYADKQANSRYAQRGTAGGFGASTTTPGGSTQDGPGGAQLGLAAGGVLAAGAVGLRVKRRRHT